MILTSTSVNCATTQQGIWSYLMSITSSATTRTDQNSMSVMCVENHSTRQFNWRSTLSVCADMAISCYNVSDPYYHLLYCYIYIRQVNGVNCGILCDAVCPSVLLCARRSYAKRGEVRTFACEAIAITTLCPDRVLNPSPPNLSVRRSTGCATTARSS